MRLARSLFTWFVLGAAACGDPLQPVVELRAEPVVVDVAGAYRDAAGVVATVRIVNLGDADARLVDAHLASDADPLRLALVDPGFPVRLPAGGVTELRVSVLDLTALPADLSELDAVLVVDAEGLVEASVGCGAQLTVEDTTVTAPIAFGAIAACDLDRDGSFDVACGGEDCDDLRADVHPGADERCNGVDDDCDDTVDEPDAIDALVIHADTDGDGYGDPLVFAPSCTVPDGWSEDGTDCDDGDDTAYPTNVEACDRVDNDCDGAVDEAGATGELAWYADVDEDGFGDAGDPVRACAAPDGFVADDRDCDDALAAVNPDADEVCNRIDDDCDGVIDTDAIDQRVFWADTDADGFGDPAVRIRSCGVVAGYVANDRDCDDDRAATYPGAPEACNGADDDCDVAIDEDPAFGPQWWVDRDTDGYGAPGAPVIACAQPDGRVGNDDDCDDRDRAVHPTADERCNGVDDDCDVAVDEDAVDGTPFYIDADQDTFGNAAVAVFACAAPDGHVADDTDCDDDDPAIHPDAAEICDGIDNDCDGTEDGTTAWYRDADGDRFGNALVTQQAPACTGPSGYVLDDTDCDDTRPSVHPGADETCNDRDDDCDVAVDEDAVDARTFFVDADADRFGDPNATVRACRQGPGMTTDRTDCDDTRADVYPGAPERCDGVSNDCDAEIDEDPIDGTRLFLDFDRDGYGNPNVSVASCGALDGYVKDGTDCNDLDAAVNPGADERCNFRDDDCNGRIDDDAIDARTWYADRDFDRWGSDTNTIRSCTPVPGYLASGGDCDDGNASIHPGVNEQCDAIDNNCSGVADEGSVCPCPVEHFEGRAYSFCSFGLPRDIARQGCLAFGYDLAKITTRAEDVWIASTAQRYASGDWYIGLNDQSREGTYVWADNTPVTYTGWASGQPDSDDCGVTQGVSSTGGLVGWEMVNCFSFDPFVCEQR